MISSMVKEAEEKIEQHKYKYKISIRKDRKYKVHFSSYNKNSYNELSSI